MTGIGIVAALWLASEPGVVTGVIREQGKPLDQPYVSAFCSERHEGEVDPETGRFEIHLPPGECRLNGGTNSGHFSTTVEVPDGGALEVDLDLVARHHPRSESWSLLGVSLEPDLQWPARETVGIAGLNLSLGSSRRLRVYGFDLGVVNRVVDQGFGMQAGVSVHACGWVGLQTGVVARQYEPQGNVPGCMLGVVGAQMGLAYAKADLVIGLQLAGVIAEAFNPVGVQMAGIVSRSEGGLVGVQIAGAVAWSDWPMGVQIGGGASVANWKLDGVQLSGIANVVVEEEANGVQISSIANYAACLRGVQIGLINVARQAAGVQVGLINAIGRRVTPVFNAGAQRCAD